MPCGLWPFRPGLRVSACCFCIVEGCWWLRSVPLLWYSPLLSPAIPPVTPNCSELYLGLASGCYLTTEFPNRRLVVTFLTCKGLGPAEASLDFLVHVKLWYDTRWRRRSMVSNCIVPQFLIFGYVARRISSRQGDLVHAPYSLRISAVLARLTVCIWHREYTSWACCHHLSVQVQWHSGRPCTANCSCSPPAHHHKQQTCF